MCAIWDKACNSIWHLGDAETLDLDFKKTWQLKCSTWEVHHRPPLPTCGFKRVNCSREWTVTWLQHALRERLSVKRVGGRIEQVAQDDGSVHDVSGGQHHGVCHECVHQRVCWELKHGQLVLREVCSQGKEKEMMITLEGMPLKSLCSAYFNLWRNAIAVVPN